LDWSRIKTIFIFTFLVLDIFLSVQFYHKRSSSQLDVIAESSIEDQLKANDITYVSLPKDSLKESYIAGKSKKFDLNEIGKLKNQTIDIYDEIIESTLIHPVLIPSGNKTYFFENFAKENVWNGERYKFCKVNDANKTVYLCQTYKNRMIYNINNSFIELKYNDKNEIVSYKQRYLEGLKEMVDKQKVQEVLPAIKAIENMYEKDELKPGDKVTQVDFGYYTIIPLSTGVKVLAPAWHLIVNDKVDYFVNAIEGQVIKVDSKQWSE
jgi:regulatory protein YycI of two-component signal transduction system YycFG